MNRITSGKTIGILGGGQLGKMLCIEAAKLGYKTITYCPKTSEEAPAFQVSNEIIYQDYDNITELKKFADRCDIVTFEFENIPASSVKSLGDKIKPSHIAISVSQNRKREREFLVSNNFPTHKFEYISNGNQAKAFIEKNNLDKAIIKTASFGYDGKGQIRVNKHSDIEKLWHESGFEDAVIEEFISFEKEISVILARKENGDVSFFPIGENIHLDGILKQSIVPASIKPKTTEQAKKIALNIAEKLDYIGVIAVEFFVLENGDLYVNEMAPRVHNSGHWSLDGCVTNQFEQHIRAICGLEFGSTQMLVNQVVMKNIIGNEMHDIDKYYTDPNAKIHNYNKGEIRSGRKLAHVNIINYS